MTAVHLAGAIGARPADAFVSLFKLPNPSYRRVG